jgi:integrase
MPGPRRLREALQTALEAVRSLRRADDYGLILEGAILAVGETAMRPNEVFALHDEDVDYEQNVITMRRAIDINTGAMTRPKDDDKRVIVMSPTLREHLLRMPRLSKIPFPAPRGGYMLRELV